MCDEFLRVMSANLSSSECIPLHVREIVSHCLFSPSPIQAEMRAESHDRQAEKGDSRGRVGEGRRETETKRLREILAKLQKENEELHLKHIAASEKATV